MGLSLVFHTFFTPIGIGMPLLLFVAEGIGLRTGDPRYRRLARAWTPVVGLLFAVGAVSGTVLSFELGLLWPEFMKFAGGIIGNQFGSGGGKAAATIGGVVLGGALGNKIGSDIDCRDRPHAFRAYNDSFRGPIGRRYDWNGGRGRGRGYITTTREYHRRGMLCRDFQETTYRRGRAFTREGTACRYNDGWHLM